MPQYTPRLNLYKPGGGSSGLITPDEVVDVDRINANSDIIDAAVAALQDREKKFSLNVADATERDAWYTSPALGDRVFQRDVGMEMVHNGSNWQPAIGLIPVRPTTVTNGSGVAHPSWVIDPDGSVRCTATTNERLNLNGIFNFSKFRSYRVLMQLGKASGTSTASAIFRSAAGDISTNTYYGAALWSFGGGAVTPGSFGSESNMKSAVVDSSGGAVYSAFDVFLSNIDGTGKGVVMMGQVSAIGGSYELKQVAAWTTVSVDVTGYGLSPGQNVAPGSRFRVYAYA